MVSLESFGERKELAARVLHSISEQLTKLLGEEARFELVSEPDAGLLARMLELEEEVFRIEDNVYSESDIRECLAEEDSLLLVLSVNNRVEGYVFGYDDEPEDPVVEGTDYFVDSAVISLAYQAKGIGARVALPLLFLIYLLGYRAVGLTTEERDKSGRKLARFYRKLGFSDARTNRPGDVGLKINLTEETIGNLARLLPNTAYVSGGLQG